MQYHKTHVADDYYAAVQSGPVSYEEVSVPVPNDRGIPYLWLGFRVVFLPPHGQTLDVVFAQKNVDMDPRLPVRLRTVVEAADTALCRLAKEFPAGRIGAVRAAGRYGWQRFAKAFGYSCTGQRSSCGYPLFIKDLMEDAGR